MEPGTVTRVSPGSALYYLDPGAFGPATYCSVYLYDTPRPAVIDTGLGTNYQTILDALETLGIDCADLAIVPTHVHLDHAGGAGYLAEACPEATVYVHEAGASHLVDPARLWAGTRAAVGEQIQYYIEPKPVPEARIVELGDGDRIDLGDRELSVHHAPGHAFHQAVFQDQSTGGVFTADAAGIHTPGVDGVRPTSPPPGFDLAGCLADVEMIQELDPTALYYAHFGPAEPADLLDEYATVLESWVESVADKRAELGADDAVVEYFVSRTDTVEAWGPVKARAETAMNVRGVLEYLDEA
ncbi:MBL fold metallo-hydrolase [Halodesulfurarchaeum formicicum]|uniref:Beta-lactamase domain protein n=1 Tax=Halodesulfurarchaeum formicicum TaxID=1873524 RepID=A0A1J1AC91_9EURY|nr:MBL fold metallo-hydrolase [Halodesulfurarchaeum formicicum]APE95764.1 beta-lactamase domain protein [Halodesulfurarchaeum formicicum]